ncbi:hypothetical protein A8709_04800 [Paenibacillus pectinilyticus]|uniref:Uncharacterized protein n=1 Tax=Paenibacillus pectinilyticus TaxID=512399 RepID=A0A1C0ZSG7_9BACL|nr:hypothetical protein A8709_04800 [Paenibacillus pectinilyticus]
MINLEKVYCVECKATMDKSHAKKVFKTGYYHTTIPLAHCLKCETVPNIFIHSYEGMAVESWI